jgi:hypothetical protein
VIGSWVLAMSQTNTTVTPSWAPESAEYDMKLVSLARVMQLATRLLCAACGAALALVLFSSVAAGHGYHSYFPRLFRMSPASCYQGCLYQGHTYYSRGGVWYAYTGGQWYYYNSCTGSWISTNGTGTIQSASGW